MKKEINIHLFTDSTGETLGNITSSIMSQFNNHKAEIFVWPFLKTKADMDAALEAVKIKQGIIMYTILPEELVQYLYEKVKTIKNTITISALNPIVNQFSQYLGEKINTLIGRNTNTDIEYEQKRIAMQFTFDHDDGKMMTDIENANIVIIGVSRTSKTPTSFYLSYRGYKVINIPFVSEKLMPKELYNSNETMVIGLTIEPTRLLYLRENRLLSEQNNFESKYTNIINIENEIHNCRAYCSKIGCPVIDVTEKSIEEVSSSIIKMFNLRKINKKD